MAFVSPKRFTAWLLSLLTALAGAALLTSAFLAAEHPLQYLHSTAATVAYLLFALNALLQLPPALSDCTISAAFAPTDGSGWRKTLIYLLPLAGILPFAIESISLVTASTGGARISALLTAVLFIIGAVGLLLRLPPMQLTIPLGCAAFAFYLYFERVTPRNASLKLLVSLAFLLLALLLLLRLRHALGLARPRLTIWFIRAAAPYLFSLGVMLALLQGARDVAYPLATVSLLLLVLSFYLYMAYLPPTLGFARRSDDAAKKPPEHTPSDSREPTDPQNRQGTDDL